MISNIPSAPVSVIAPYAPQGRAPVGQESGELKSTTFKATEQLAESGRGLNRRLPDERPNDDVEQDRVNAGRPAGQGATSGDSQTADARQQAEQKQIQELAARDREVRAHEQAHAAIAGQHGGSPSYTYVRGPDGVSYAVGGEVSIDTSPIPGDPEATIRKAQQLKRAANAPAEPSGQDRQVAAQATQMEQEARLELREQQAIGAGTGPAQKSGTGSGETSGNAPTGALSEQAQPGSVASSEQSVEDDQQREQERLREEEQLQEEQRLLDQRRAELFSQAGQRNLDLNRRLADIGVFGSSSNLGSFLNKTV